MIPAGHSTWQLDAEAVTMTVLLSIINPSILKRVVKPIMTISIFI